MAYDPSTHRLFLFGGSCGDGGDFNDEIGGVLNDTWVYNPTTNTWGELSAGGAVTRWTRR